MQPCLGKRYEALTIMFDVPHCRWLVIALLILESTVQVLFLFAVGCVWIVEAYSSIKNTKRCKISISKTELSGSFPQHCIFVLCGMLIFVAVLVDICELFGQNMLSDTYHTVLFSGVLLISFFSLATYGVMFDSGIYFIMIQKMSLHLVYFLFLYSLFCIPMVTASQRLLLRGQKAEECMYDFGLSMGLVYTLVVNLVATVDIATTTLDSVDEDANDAVQLMYIFFIFIVAIVLVNFLIALFSFYAGDIKKIQEVHLLIWRLRVGARKI